MPEYELFVIEGDFRDFADPATPYIRFGPLEQEDARDLLELSLAHGYQVVVSEYMEEQNGQKEGGTTR